MSMVPNFVVMVILRGMSGFFLASLRQEPARKLQALTKQPSLEYQGMSGTTFCFGSRSPKT